MKMGVYFRGISAVAETYYDAVMADTPLGYWRLNNPVSGDNAYDETANGYTLLYTGPSQVMTRVAGLMDDGTTPRYASATRQDSALPHVHGGVKDLSGTYDSEFNFTNKAPFALECWFQVHIDAVEYGGQSYNLLMRKQNESNGAGYKFMVVGDGTGNALYLLGDRISSTPTTQQVNSSAGSISLDTTHHAFLDYDGTTLTLYLDGVSVDTDTTSLDMGDPTNKYLEIAEWAGDAFGGSLIGTIDEVAVYDHTVPATRVAYHYAVGTSQGVAVTSGPTTWKDLTRFVKVQ